MLVAAVKRLVVEEIPILAFRPIPPFPPSGALLGMLSLPCLNYVLIKVIIVLFLANLFIYLIFLFKCGIIRYLKKNYAIKPLFMFGTQ